MFLQKKFVIAVPLALLIASLLVWSCSTKPEGEEPALEKPVVQIVNIPASGSHFTTSPVINWYGTDADGYIIAYEYAVITADVILAAGVDTSSAAAIRTYAAASIEVPGPTANCDPACWTIVDVEKSDSPTRQQVRLIAGSTPADTVVQFFFVRAIDNDSVSSVVEFSIYSRNNNPPTTDIVTVYEKASYYDLPDTSSAYSGISFEWKGADKIDFPSETDQPKFDFYYQVFGPYPISSLSVDEVTGKLINDSSIDTLDISKLVLSSRDTVRGGVWVEATTGKFHNLWRNAPLVDTTEENYFVVKVTARDDAFAPDPTPEYRAFRVINPKFENRVLVYAKPDCSPRSGNISCNERSDTINIYTISEIIEWEKQVFVKAGYPDAVFVPTAPDKKTAAKYKLIVLLGDGDDVVYDGVSSDRGADFKVLTEYMNLGGNVWVWSTNPFGGFYTGEAEGLRTYATANSIPYRYFRVLAEYREAWRLRYQSRSLWLGSDETAPENSDQFLGGLALAGSGFEDFVVDLPKIQLTYNCKRGSGIVTWKDEVVFRGAPSVNYMVRDVFSEPLFLYRSCFDGNVPDSLKQWLAPMHGTVIAVRQAVFQYKSAAFCFSMWMMKEDDAIALLSKMMEWFLS